MDKKRNADSIRSIAGIQFCLIMFITVCMADAGIYSPYVINCIETCEPGVGLLTGSGGGSGSSGGSSNGIGSSVSVKPGQARPIQYIRRTAQLRNYLMSK